MLFSYQAPRSLALATLISFAPAALIPQSSRAELLNPQNTLRYEKDGYLVEQVATNTYKISNKHVVLSVERISGDESLMRINGRLFSFENDKSQKYNEQKLGQFLKLNVKAKNQSSSNFISYISDLIFPSAHALNWWAIGLGLIGVVGIIIGIKAMKDADKNDEQNDARYSNQLASYDKRISYQNCMGDRYSGKSEESCDGSHK